MKIHLAGFYLLLVLLTLGLMTWGQFSFYEKLMAVSAETLGFIYGVIAMFFGTWKGDEP